MASMSLVIGTKNLSSWSLRAWLLLRHFGIGFDEVELALDTAEFAQQVQQWSPTSRVPVLIDGDLRLWDSLAICEYVSDAYLSGRGWPASISDRAIARCLVAEMHSGFAAMRTEMPMDIQRPPSAVQLSDAALGDVARVEEIWDGCLARRGGPWLFGDFTIVDAFYAPVASRFITYATNLKAAAAGYRDQVAKHPAMLEWARQSATGF